ncbi:MAG: hypothetical protein IPF38_19705 [Burkholderiales bacterium]|nr:hypothetical protein [Burkholderiales bacterium]
MDIVTPLEKFTIPLGGQVIELQQFDYEAGGMSLLRTRIREKSRFTVFEIDPGSARLGEKPCCAGRRRRNLRPLPAAEQDAAVEAVFRWRESPLPRDHAQALQHALTLQIPWLHAEDAGAGIHPVKLVAGPESVALLSQRTRLILRSMPIGWLNYRPWTGFSWTVMAHPSAPGCGASA